MTNEHQNYVKLLALIPSIHDTNFVGAAAEPGSKDITAEVMQRHYKKIIVKLLRESKAGEAIPDLEFTIAMYTEAKMAEVLTYRDRFGYRKVYSDDMMTVSPSTKAELNSFLAQWLSKLLEQRQAPEA